MQGGIRALAHRRKSLQKRELKSPFLKKWSPQPRGFHSAGAPCRAPAAKLAAAGELEELRRVKTDRSCRRRDLRQPVARGDKFYRRPGDCTRGCRPSITARVESGCSDKCRRPAVRATEA